MEIDKDKLKKDLLEHADELQALMLERALLAKDYGDIVGKVNDYNDELTDDISKNPEKYGYPIGERPQNYKIRAIVRQDTEYRSAEQKKRDYEYKLAVCEAKIEALKMKDADYRCLLLHAD